MTKPSQQASGLHFLSADQADKSTAMRVDDRVAPHNLRSRRSDDERRETGESTVAVLGVHPPADVLTFGPYPTQLDELCTDRILETADQCLAHFRFECRIWRSAIVFRGGWNARHLARKRSDEENSLHSTGPFPKRLGILTRAAQQAHSRLVAANSATGFGSPTFKARKRPQPAGAFFIPGNAGRVPAISMAGGAGSFRARRFLDPVYQPASSVTRLVAGADSMTSRGSA